MNHTLKKIDKFTWFTNDKQYAIIKAFGRKKYWIGKLTFNPDTQTIWRVERCVNETFTYWKDARHYLIYNIYNLNK